MLTNSVVCIGPRFAAVTAGCVRTAEMTSGGAVSLSSISSAIGDAIFHAPPNATRVDLRRVGKPDATAPNGVGQLAQDRDGRVPANAGVGDAHAVGERLAG